MLSCLGHLALAAVTVLAWHGLGSVLLRALPQRDEPLLELVNRLASGALAFALLTFAVGWAGGLYTAAYVPALALAACAGAVSFARLLPRLPRPSLAGWEPWEVGLAVL